MDKLSLLLPLLAAMPLGAMPVFDRIFQDEMLLQRDVPVPVWGTAKAGDTVKISWKGENISCKANSKGVWKAELPAKPASAEGAVLAAEDSEGKAELQNVLSGDLWMASGQSNMAFRINECAADDKAVDWNNPQLRLLNVGCKMHTKAGQYSVEDYERWQKEAFFTWRWSSCTPQSVQSFSAVAAYFAERVQRETGVPIGIICNAVGGSGMEAWMPASLIRSKELYKNMRGDNWLQAEDFDAWMRSRASENLRKLLEAGKKDFMHPFKPSFLFEGSTAPLCGLPIKGVIWYQGESNAEEESPDINIAKLTDMIGAWRKAWKNEKLPFLMVQLPRINDPKRPHWGAFRTAQKRVARALEGVDLICTVDLGSTDSNVHPEHKGELGTRLADLALRSVYGKSGLATYPELQSAEASKGKVVLHFDQELASADGQAPRGFEVADARYGNFSSAEAKIAGKDVILSFPSKGKATDWNKALAWRYNDGTMLQPNLVGMKGKLPAFPERSYTGHIARKAVPLGKFPAAGKLRVACVGDSITFGYGIPKEEDRYPEKLGKLLGENFEVARFGNSGKTAGDVDKGRKRWYGHQREYAEAKNFAADVYICNLGINDTGLGWWDAAESEKGYQELIDGFKGKHGASVVLWGKLAPDFRGPKGEKRFPGNVFPSFNFPANDNGSSQNRAAMEGIIVKLAKKNKCRLIDMYSPLCQKPEAYQKDGLHPKPEGTTTIAETTANWLRKQYKLKN